MTKRKRGTAAKVSVFNMGMRKSKWKEEAKSHKGRMRERKEVMLGREKGGGREGDWSVTECLEISQEKAEGGEADSIWQL